jgi:uncharacterized protein (TIGR02300 family)
MEAVTKAKLGQRWVCFKCNARFYDLNKPDPLCPKCNANQRESPAFQKPTKKRPTKKAAVKKEVVPAPAEEVELRRAERPERGVRAEDEAEAEFTEDTEFELDDLELEEGAEGDEDSVGLVEVEED